MKGRSRNHSRAAGLLQVNDAVGTLAGARYYDPDVVVAVILGTGSNACYEEREDTSFRLVGPPPASGHMVINIEWGNFNSPLLPVTTYDSQVDKNSPNPGEQVHPTVPSIVLLLPQKEGKEHGVSTTGHACVCALGVVHAQLQASSVGPSVLQRRRAHHALLQGWWPPLKCLPL